MQALSNDPAGIGFGIVDHTEPVTTPPGPARPKFRVLDVVDNNVDERGGRGVVYVIRRYVDDTFRYSIGPLDPDDEVTGGLYSEDQLIPTGERVTVEHYWAGSFRHGEVVQIADSHPKKSLRGQFGQITDEISPDKRYTVMIANLDRGEHSYRYPDVAAEHLERTGERIPPSRVPRPVVTSRAATNPHNTRPSYEFDIYDEIDQYL